MKKLVFNLILTVGIFSTVQGQKTIKAEQFVSFIPKISDKETDENEPEYGMWLRGMMCDVYENIKASSISQASGNNTYGTSNLSDDNPQTAWVEGKDDYGVGEYLQFNRGSDLMRIYNGYQKDEPSFWNNSRVKAFKVYLDNKYVGDILLNDKPGQQQINMSLFGVENYKTIKLEIKEVYPGKKWKDTAISELFWEGG